MLWSEEKQGSSSEGDRMFGISGGQRVVLVWSQPVDGEELKSLVEQLQVTLPSDSTQPDLVFFYVWILKLLKLK